MTFRALRKSQVVYTILLVRTYSKEISKPSKFKQGLSCAPGFNLSTKAKAARNRKLHTHISSGENKHAEMSSILKLGTKKFFGTDTYFSV